MNNTPIDESTTLRNAKKTGMYISLFVCVAALVLGFGSAVNRTTKLASQNVTSKAAYSTTAVQTTTKAQTKENKFAKIFATTQPTAEKTTKSTVASFFVMPVGGEITMPFSNTELQYSKTYCDWRMHFGVDITAKKGTEVHAAGNGAVSDVYEDELLGNVVVIDHGNGIVAYYCGIDVVTVKKGDAIDVGQLLGGIGDIPSESVEQNHLHFAVMKSGKWVDPIKTLSISNR